MKKYLPFLSLAFVFAACGNGSEKTETKTLQTAQPTTMDTAGLSQFQQWKAQNELNATQQPAQTQTQPQAQAPSPEPQVRTVVREVRLVEKPVARKRVASPKAQTMPAPEPVKTTTSDGSGNSDVATNSGNGSGTEAQPSTTQEEKKKGWSKSAKGAVIGGGAGAVIGAVINKKNPAAGAVIGGVLGGAVGYGIGKSKDKKDGRN